MLIVTDAPILLDTHIILWLLSNPDKLTAREHEIIAEGSRDCRLHVSAITFWEIATLVAKKRVTLTMPIKDFFYAIANIPGIRVEPLSIDAAAQVHDMHDVVHGDPADRMIIATAQVIKASILTRDCKIIEYCRGGLLALKE